MAFTEQMKSSFSMDRLSGSGRTDSTIDDSPFGSSLNTPMDEDTREPFAAIGEKLKEIEAKKSEKPPHFTDSQVQEQPTIQDHIEVDGNQDSTSQAVIEENSDISLSSISDTSASLISSFPVVPFSSPEVTNDQVLPASIVPFSSRELSRSLQNIEQPLSVEHSPAVIAPSASIQSTSSLEDNPMLHSPGSEHDFNAHSRASSLYTLPNVAISPSMIVSGHSELETVDLSSAQVVPSAPATQSQALKSQNNHFQEDFFSFNHDFVSDYTDPEPEYTFSALRSLDFSPSNLPILFFKMIFFIPWCALVGGTILLFPTYIEQIAFNLGGVGDGRLCLNYVPSPPKGIQRFAHWAECAIAHIMIFLATFGCGMWFLACGTGNNEGEETDPGLGLPIALAAAIALIAQMFVAWHDFDFKLGGSTTGRSSPEGYRPLGEDDRDSIWIVVRMYVLGEESKIWLSGNLEKDPYVVNCRESEMVN